jgi:chemotaxis protein CheC
MKLTSQHLDALQEIINIGVGWAASIFNDMIDSHIQLQIPTIEILSPQEATKEIETHLHSEKVSSVCLNFTGSLKGNAQLIFPVDSASKLLSVLTHEPEGSPDLDAVKIGTLTEVGNILINGVIGSISNLMEQKFDYSLPSYFEGQCQDLLDSNGTKNKATILLAQTNFTIEKLYVEGGFILIFNLGSFEQLIEALNQELGLSS